MVMRRAPPEHPVNARAAQGGAKSRERPEFEKIPAIVPVVDPVLAVVVAHHVLLFIASWRIDRRQT